MTPQNKRHIQKLVGRYAEHYDTELIILFVANSTGMFAACRALLECLEDSNSKIHGWLENECSMHDVTMSFFTHEVYRLVTLFTPNTEVTDPHYITLGLSRDASKEDIKRAFRELSLRYHPDTTSAEVPDDSERFIEVTNAYHSLLAANSKKLSVHFTPQENSWREKKMHGVSNQQRKKLFWWSFGVITVLVFFTILGSIYLRKKAMLAGLNETRSDFKPQPTKVVADVPRPLVISNDSSAILHEESAGEAPTLVPDYQRNSLEIANEYDKQKKAMRSIGKIGIRKETTVQQSTSIFSIKPEKLNDMSVINAEIPGEILSERNNDTNTNRLYIFPVDEMQARTNRLVLSENSTPINPVALTIINSRTYIYNTAKYSREGFQPVVLTGQYKRAIKKSLDDKQSNAEQDFHSGSDVFTEIANSEKDLRKSEKDSQVNMHQESAYDSSEGQRELNSGYAKVVSEKTHDEHVLQSKVDEFLKKYLEAYKQRDIGLFISFFEDDATENNKPFSSLRRMYSDLFASANILSLELDNLVWYKKGDKISIQADFRFYQQYRDSHQISGKGPITFLLIERGRELRIDSLNYDFELE